MIICNSKKFIYLHMHKTAGTSIEQAIAPHLQWNDIILGSTNYGEKNQQIYYQRFYLNKHSTGQECYNVVGKEVWDSYFKFATIRNPYSLVVSTFTYAQRILNMALLRGQIDYEKARLFLENRWGKYIYWTWRSIKRHKTSNNRIFKWPIVKALIESGYPEPSFSRYLQSKYLWNDKALTPQWEKLAVSKGASPHMDLNLIIKMEELEQQWPLVCERIGMNIELPHLNKSSKQKWQEYYANKKNRVLVEKKFAIDFENFDYSICQ